MQPNTNRWPLKILALVLICLALSLDVCAQNQKQILITTEESYPSSMLKEDGKTIYGRTADKIHEIMQRSHIPYQMQLLNWNRAFELARTQSDTCVFAAARTSERESYFKWIGPISRGSRVIIGPRDRLGKITELSQIRDATIGVNLGDVLYEVLTQQGFNVVRSYDDDTSLKNLLMGRLDYWASDASEASAKLVSANVTDRLNILFSFGAVDYYLACNPEVSDDLIESMRSNLKKIKADGTVDKINRRY